MELDAVRVFVDVVKQGSFAAVARQRDMDPSSISRSISNLENELGFRLFQRTTRKLATTEAGAAYFDRVEGLVGEFDLAGEAALDLVSSPTGTLRVTACTSFGQRVLAPVLPELRSRYPDLTIDLHLVDHTIDIVEDKVDLAVRFGEKPDGDFIVSRLVPRHFRVCASPEYVEQHGTPENPRELADHDCLLFSFPGYRSAWKFRSQDEAVFAVSVSGHVLTSHGVTMTKCAVAGLGPALLPDWLCADEIRSGELVDLFPGYECTATQFDTSAWLVYPSRSYLPLKLRAFIDFLREKVEGAA
ncbi:MAG: LysR family transcriptional regulator [Lysobacteraceae bacterium]|nr:MAG: LysR family transcriptional regulator [Xanthomonadaceae bacterium]